MTACFTKLGDGYIEAEAFERLVQGEGHYFSFADGLQASTGLNPMPGYNAVVINFNNGLAGLPGYLRGLILPNIEYDAQLGEEWTIIFRDGLGGGEFVDTGAALRSDGFYVLNGGASSGTWYPGSWPTTLEVDVVDGVLRLSGTGSNVDDLVILPFRASESMMNALTEDSGGDPMWGPLPVHRITGDVIAEDHAFMVGEVTGVRFVQKPQEVSGNVSTMWVNNAKLVDFTLAEVPRAFVRADVL